MTFNINVVVLGNIDAKVTMKDQNNNNMTDELMNDARTEESFSAQRRGTGPCSPEEGVTVLKRCYRTWWCGSRLCYL